MNSHIVSQEYDLYTGEDHGTWATLNKRQQELQAGRLSKEYRHGFDLLSPDREHIVRIDEISRRLEAISGWTLVPVTGLIPTRDFFYMLINKRYPVTVAIRKPWEIDFSEQPDIYHDVCGHLPLLTNEKFVKFLTGYSIIALKYVNNDRAVDFLGRFYWYTYEMGLINENGTFRPYGGAIITSSQEALNVERPDIPKHPFSLGRIFKTPYNPYKLQNEYFVIESFDELFECLETLEAKLMEHLLLPDHDPILRNYSLNHALGKEFNNVIGFLNDAQFRFPEAISFVAGQPDESFFDIEGNLSCFESYVDFRMKASMGPRKDIVNKLGQYSKTKGIINDIIAEYLRTDENIQVRPDDILITAGAQEAFAIIVSTICNREQDVILTEDPSYIGLSSFAKIFKYPIQGVGIDENGIDLRELKRKLIELHGIGKKVKLLYVIPDYQNPSGSCMPIGNRLKLLDLARQYNFLLIEDSVYNSFTYEEKKHPTLKSLDKFGRVVYVGSFSKSLFPGLRIGLIAADQVIENENAEAVPLMDEMVKVKAQLTNNTSAISQAVVGGVLLENNFSLSEWNKPKFRSYRQKRDLMAVVLNRHLKVAREAWAGDISWTVPDGGFFLRLSVPFSVDTGSVYECAEKFGVIFCPMRYFYLNGGGEKEIRLTFSNLSLEQIDEGIGRLAAYLKFKVESTTRSRLVTEESNSYGK
jgi:(S)-3,5-dihydroxyphenylglycine transaminase